jgi:Co/Zn/Cd efflux system component
VRGRTFERTARPRAGPGSRGGWTRARHALAERLPFGHSHEGHGHDEGPDDALESSEEGIRALKASLILLMLTTLFQAAIVVFSGSAALLADAVHNFGDALTAVPLWVAFALSRRRPPAPTPTATAGPRI